MPAVVTTDPVLRLLQYDGKGFRLGPCRLEQLLGTGGMGRVYAGEHLGLAAKVAVKVLNPSGDGAPRGTIVDRFRREASLAASVEHPNLVRVLDAGDEQGLLFIVMELVEGETARRRVERKGRLDLLEALAVAFGTAKALEAAHAKRIVHRDVKPGNVLISRDAKIKLTDLGLAKSLDASGALTRRGSRLGTPRYAAPEQWRDASSVTPATDVWGLGAVLFFLLTGRDGVRGVSPLAILRETCETGFPRLAHARPELPPEVDAYVARCTAQDPKDRFQDAKDARVALEALIRRVRPAESDVADSPRAAQLPRLLVLPAIACAGLLLVWSLGPDGPIVRGLTLLCGAASLVGFVAWRRDVRRASPRDARLPAARPTK